MKRCLTWFLIVIMGVCVFLLNYYSVPGHDEMSYAFWGQHTPMVGDVNRVSSLMDVVRQQYGDYMTAGGNGRVLTHGLVALVAGFRLYTFFDVVNTFVWFLFVWLILREGHIQIKNIGTYLMGSIVVWWFLWYGETCSLNAAFAVNYLWIACMTIIMMRVWRALNSWWIVPLFLVYGWTSEAFVLPMIAALAADAVTRCFVEKRIVFNRKQVCAWGLTVVGACFLCLGPASQVRSDGTLAGNIIMSAIKANLGLILLGAPFILFLGILTVLWMRRKTLFKAILESLEWWLFLGASFGLYCLVSANGVVRLAMPMLLAGVIILFREHAIFKIKRRLGIAFSILCVSWMLGATVLQAHIGGDVCKMLDCYRKDEQGITFRNVIPTGPFYYSASTLVYNDWHAHLFRREFGHQRNPVVLTRWLYESLYLEPTRFFESSRELEKSGLYVSMHCPKAVVACGHGVLTEEQKQQLEDYYESLQPSVTGWRRFLPGRLKVMFPAEDFFLNIVKEDKFCFVARDGNPYTLYLPSEKRH